MDKKEKERKQENQKEQTVNQTYILISKVYGQCLLINRNNRSLEYRTNNGKKIISFPFLKVFHIQLALIDKAVSEEKIFEIVDGRRTDAG